MKKIAITGGIGSGKSTVLRCLAKMGYSTFSCDEIYSEIIKTPEYVRQIKKIFPDCVTEEGVDRKKLATIVFNDEAQRKRLNQVAHPLIMRRLYERMAECSSEYVFAEVPLLFEGGFEKDFDGVFVVTRSINERISSLQKRDGATEQEIRKKIRSQFHYSGEEGKRRLKACNTILLMNDGEMEILEKRIKKALKKATMKH